ncbi:AraC family ligand binding domain-containing protein [Terrimonas alba]|uniref:AraC family ligand binding domain-containing protein n=1 Tax=Terrimonas alba TaxID=3349636 RepID=UPI0035F3D226
MEIKRTEATLNRPEGARAIDASYIFTDIAATINQLKDEKAWDKNDRNGITVFKSGNIRIVISALKAGAFIKENEVEGYMSIQMLRGKAVFTASEGDVQLKENQLVTLHPHVIHSFKAVSDCIVLLSTYVK